MGMCGTGSFSATFFVPSAVNSIFRLDALSAAYIISTGFTAAIFANLLLGYLNDHFNRWNVMSGAIAIMIPASFALTTTNLLLFRVAAAVVLAVGLATCNQVYAIAGDVLRGSETGNVMGIIGLGGGIFGYVGPQALGLLRDWTGGFSAGWYLLTGVAALATIEILYLRQTGVRQPIAARAGA